MTEAEKLLPGESLRQGFPKLNMMIDMVNYFQKQIDQMVIEGDSSVEAAQARVDGDGTTYTTLKERLDTEHSEVTSSLAQTQTRLKDVTIVRNALDYGVTNDGVDTEDAINALPEGYEYEFPAGKYAVRGFAISPTTGEPWFAGIKAKPKTKYTFLPGAEIEVIPNNSRLYSAFYIGSNAKDFEISGAVVKGDREEHDFSTGSVYEHQHGHGFFLEGAPKGKVIDSYAYNTTGDGFDVICAVGSDLEITNCKTYYTTRNGIAIESVDRLVLHNFQTDKTIGTLPEAGIDIEPWSDTAIMNDVIITNPTLKGSNNVGISIASLDRCIKGYNIRIETPLSDGITFGHGMSKLNGNLIINGANIKGGRLGIVCQSKPNARIISPTIEIDPSKVNASIIPAPIYIYDGSTSGGEVGEFIIENAVILNKESSLFPVYFGNANSFKNIDITFKRCDIERAINWDFSKARTFTNVKIGNLPIPPTPRPTGYVLGNGSLLKRKITNKGATAEAMIRIYDNYHLVPIAEFEFEVVSPHRLTILSGTGHVIYPFGMSTVYSNQVGARVKVKYDYDANGNGAFYITEMVGTWNAL